jgi:aspartate-semialdehyde dehydrogenase
MKKVNVAIVGITGLVGNIFLEALDYFDIPIKELKLFASKKSEGKEILFRGKKYLVNEISNTSFINMDFALFSAGKSVALEYAPIAKKSGCIVIDNSSAFREYDDIPLVVPEINMHTISDDSLIIANPNCSTIQSVLPIFALKNYEISRINYTTYQSVSGSGFRGLEDLKLTKSGEKGVFYPADISKTCIPQIDDFLDNGYTKEEMKMVNETKKILGCSTLLVSATCVRVPVPYCHAVSICVDLKNDFEIKDIINDLKKTKGIYVYDDPTKPLYPLSTTAANTNTIFVGRIRKDLSLPNSVLMYVVADNLRRGAAYNAVMIMKEILKGALWQ